MSEATIDPAVIKRTQDILGKYVKKPVLSEKLLKKPPFRFLHDVINAFVRDTGYFEGLYTADELNFENINDRDAKIQFLQKLIDAIKIVSSEPLAVRASKIVAGHEPEKTNDLLQQLGLAVEKKIDWKVAVNTVNGIDDPPPTAKSKSKEKEVKEKKAIEKPSPKVEGGKRSEVSKEKGKGPAKDKTKSKEVINDAKDKSSRKSSRSTAVDKKEEKKSKSKTSLKEPSKKVSPDKLKKPPVASSIVEPSEKSIPKLISEEKNSSKDEPSESEKFKEPIQNGGVKGDSKKDTPPENETSLEEFKRDERSASKRAEEILLAAAAEDTGSESRRSSASKRSSAKSRKSSAEKSRSTRHESTETPKGEKTRQEPTESLKTVAEEPAPEAKVNPSLKSQPSQDLSHTSEVKRESTFVRENSKDNPARPRTSLRPPSARPASARPGAPRRRDKNIEIILQPNDQVKLPAANIKLETFNAELEDDGENLVIIESPNSDDHLQDMTRHDNAMVDDGTLQQGHLVQQILETQKELVQGGTPDNDKKLDKDVNNMPNLSSRQSSARQMNSLRDVIQNLTKSVNPLGKLMDFIPEDIDAMQLELTMWRDTYTQSSVELKKERSLTESVTEPMKNQLVTIEATIKEYHEMIDGCRAKILQNAEKIQRLLTTQ